jgi:hypothetical protein
VDLGEVFGSRMGEAMGAHGSISYAIVVVVRLRLTAGALCAAALHPAMLKVINS